MPDETSDARAPEDGDDDLDALIAAAQPKVFQFKTTAPEMSLPEAITQELLASSRARFGGADALALQDGRSVARSPSANRGSQSHRRPPVPAHHRSARPAAGSRRGIHEGLGRFKAGDLLGFLLRLDEDQLKLTQWAMKGPTMVRGGAGTGKSTVALYRVKALLERPGATGTERVLFTTYTRSLLTVTQQLLEQLLSPEQMKRVEVATATRSRGARRQGSQGRPARIRQRRAQANCQDPGDTPPGGSAFEAKLRARALERLTDVWLLEEFEWIIEGRGLTCLAEYQAAARPGRGLPLNERARAAVWDLYEAFSKGTGERYPALRREALQLLAEDAQAVATTTSSSMRRRT